MYDELYEMLMDSCTVDEARATYDSICDECCEEGYGDCSVCALFEAFKRSEFAFETDTQYLYYL